MNIIKSIPTAIFSILVAAGAHAQQPLTPADVTQLFIGTLVHVDTAAMRSLNDYQRPARAAAGNDGDFINIEKMMETDASFAQKLSVSVMRQVKISEEDKAVLEPIVVTMLQSIRDAQKRTVCKTGEVEAVTEGVHAGYQTVTVEFACLAVNPPEKITTVLRRAAAEEWNTLEQYRSAMLALTNEYNNAPMTQEFNGKFPLSSKIDDVVWQNIFPRESLDINKALL